jgi:hypothetical protein
MTEKKMPRRGRGTDEIASALYESLVYNEKKS